MPKTPTKADAPKETLSPGDPEASYTSPDLSAQDGTGTLPDEEQEWHEGRDDAQKEGAEAAADADDAIVKQRRANAEKGQAASAAQASAPGTTAPKATSSSSS